MFPVNNSNWKYKYDFISITMLIFCPCLSKSKTLKKEYDYLYNKLESYCDFVKVTRLLMLFKEETENMRKCLNDINCSIQNEQFYQSCNTKNLGLNRISCFSND